jgi:hypothetical protein
MTLQRFVGSWPPLRQFRKLFYIHCRIPWTEDQPVARTLPTHGTTQTQNKCTQISMPRVGFEPTIPTSEQAKTFHALDRAATVIGGAHHCFILFPTCDGNRSHHVRYIAESKILSFRKVTCPKHDAPSNVFRQQSFFIAVYPPVGLY